MDELLADLGYIAGYAAAVQAEMVSGRKPTMGFVNRMAELAEKVQRELDPQFEEWCNNAEARLGNGPCGNGPHLLSGPHLGRDPHGQRVDPDPPL